MNNVSRWSPLLLVSFVLAGCQESEQITDDLRPKRVADEPLACEPGEIQFALGCALVQDDRLIVRGPSTSLDWLVTSDRRAYDLFDGTVPPSGRFIARNLDPSTWEELEVSTVDVRGAKREYKVVVKMGELMPHPVLNEVYANPFGSEPAQEWIEIHNDGLMDVELGDLILRDDGGERVLPAFALQHDEYVLLTREDLKTKGGQGDPSLQGCDVVSMQSLGKNGLANSGETLSLVDADGVVLSQFLPVAVKDGQSASRLTDADFDDDPGSFAATPFATPCTPNQF
jgi:hypothetical protein